VKLSRTVTSEFPFSYAATSVSDSSLTSVEFREEVTNCTDENYMRYMRRLPEKLIVAQLVKKFPAFCGTGKTITLFRGARHRSLS
jgi:hypothetical protein